MPLTTATTFTKRHSKSLTITPPKPDLSLKDKRILKAPPTPICAAINEQIRRDPSYAYPHFDLASYVRHRSYTLSTLDFERSMGASFLDDGVHDILAGLISELPPSITNPPTFEVRDAREKGLGLFATSFLPPGGLIFDEHPPPVWLPLNQDDNVRPKSTSSTSSSPPSLPPPSFYEDIMQTNSVAIDLIVPTSTPHHELSTHRALFLRLSRCNHSCDPNAVWSWDASTLMLTLTALRPIAPGEEITISYISLSGNHAAQREQLKAICGFDCTCEECTLPSYVAVNTKSVVADKAEEFNIAGYGVPGSAHNPDRHGHYDTFIPYLPTFGEWYQDPTLPDTLLINAHKDALYRIEQERIASSYLTVAEFPPQPIPLSTTAKRMDSHVEEIAMCYGALGDVRHFRKWIAIAKDSRVNRKQKAVFSKWSADPSSFPLWGKRGQIRV
ncbi:hypothetical protein NP233_g10068 [Leucocoprinus birnbaumii]|uniref:SET domain-containing protein n=1 Tax=Leucocoprinus birnbaumii TaxID=56174 RepID=A0AAD5VJ82_9AGAR|nr:hypothetical protein NP233_g10068 [Leucocoprinus birnbaumii]